MGGAIVYLDLCGVGVKTENRAFRSCCGGRIAARRDGQSTCHTSGTSKTRAPSIFIRDPPPFCLSCLSALRRAFAHIYKLGRRRPRYASAPLAAPACGLFGRLHPHGVASQSSPCPEHCRAMSTPNPFVYTAPSAESARAHPL